MLGLTRIEHNTALFVHALNLGGVGMLRHLVIRMPNMVVMMGLGRGPKPSFCTMGSSAYLERHSRRILVTSDPVHGSLCRSGELAGYVFGLIHNEDAIARL